MIETRDGATYFAERVWGLGLRYDLGGGHALVGRSVPDFELANGTRLSEHLRSGKGLLLDLDAKAPLQTLASRGPGRIGYLASAAKDGRGLSAVLVRPDGIVAWASESVPDQQELAQAASRWFGNAGQQAPMKTAPSPEPFRR